MARLAARLEAERLEREREALLRVVQPTVQRLARRLRVGVVRAYRSGQPIPDAVTADEDRLGLALLDLMVAAHLAGRLRVVTRAAASRAPRRRVRLDTAGSWRDALRLDRVERLDPADVADSPLFRGARTFAAERLKLSPRELQELARLYSPEAVRVARGFSRHVEQELGRTVAELIGRQAHLREGTRVLRDRLVALGLGSATSRGGVPLAQPWLLETIFRTQTQLAYAAGRYNALADPEVDAMVWGFEYVTVGDDRVRPTHAAMDGTRLPKEDPFWTVAKPPNGYNCRCSVIEVFDTDDHTIVEPRIEQLNGQPLRPQPDPGFAVDPGQLFRDAILRGVLVGV